MKKLRFYIIIPVIIAAIYLSGPKPDPGEISPELPEISYKGTDLEKYIIHKEYGIKNMKLDNSARIIWNNDSLKDRTEFAVVYLHGFSASQGEGIPIHVNFAKRYGCNLYLSRLYGHGVYEKEALIDMTPEKLVRSAAEAVAIGKKLGEKVILMSTSTGGTLSLYLAANHPGIHGLILYSPNIKINNPAASILTYPWGLQIGRLVTGGKYNSSRPESYEDSLYWTNTYRLEAVVYLQQLLNTTMIPGMFEKVTQPVFLAYYYKNKEEQDQTVRVDAMLYMYDQLGTPDSLKGKKAFPEAGEHVIACRFKSGDWEGVQQATFQFAENTLGMVPME
jgi:pimeloyl-ACP methyl ester carboxylesterase